MLGASNMGAGLASFGLLPLYEHLRTIISSVDATLVLSKFYVRSPLVATCVYYIFVDIRSDEEAGLLISNTAWASIYFWVSI